MFVRRVSSEPSVLCRSLRVSRTRAGCSQRRDGRTYHSRRVRAQKTIGDWSGAGEVRRRGARRSSARCRGGFNNNIARDGRWSSLKGPRAKYERPRIGTKVGGSGFANACAICTIKYHAGCTCGSSRLIVCVRVEDGFANVGIE